MREINLKIYEDKEIVADSNLLGVVGEHKSTRLKISAEGDILSGTAWLEFEMPDGTKVKSEALSAAVQPVVWDVPYGVLTLPGELRMQVVSRHEDGAVSKSRQKGYFVSGEIGAIQVIEDRIEALEAEVNNLESELDATNKTFEAERQEYSDKLDIILGETIEGGVPPKLVRTSEVKNGIKEALVEAGCEVSDSEPFSIYAEKIAGIKEGLNIAFGHEPPEDTKKLWIAIDEPIQKNIKISAQKSFDFNLMKASLEPINRQSGVAIVNSKCYLFGGMEGNSPVNQIRVYDIKNDEIRTIQTTLPIENYDMGCTYFDEKCYLFGGGTNREKKTIFIFDTKTEVVTTIDAFSKEYANMGATSVNKICYIFGASYFDSYFGNYPENISFKFDTTTNSLETLSIKFPERRCRIAVESLENKCYLFGGSTINNAYLKTIFVFDTETEIMTTSSATLNNAERIIATVLVKDKIYLFSSCIQIYDTKTDTIKKEEYNTPYFEFINNISFYNKAVLYENKIYLLGIKIGENFSGQIFGIALEPNLENANLMVQIDEKTQSFEVLSKGSEKMSIHPKKVFSLNSEKEVKEIPAYLYENGEWKQISGQN